MTERISWLVLLCLPLLMLAAAPTRAGAAESSPEDFLSFWRDFSLALGQLPPLAVLNGEVSFVDLILQPADPGDVRPIPTPTPLPVLDPPRRLASEGSPGPSAGSWEQPDKRPRKVSQKSEFLLGSLSSQIEVSDAPQPRIWDDPTWKRTWQTDNSWQVSVAGPLSVFGQVGANSDEAQQANMKVSGRTGLSCKLPVGSLAECTFRSGPGVSYTDPLHPLRAQGRSDWLLEFQARWPLLFGIGLEYQGSALPALTPLQQDQLNQDVRLAMPLGSTGKLKVGAKRQWTGTFDQRAAWTDNTQLYLGLELSH
jgi:hypothetical protein